MFAFFIVLLSSPAFADSILLEDGNIASHITKKTGYGYVLKEQLPNQEHLPEMIKGANIPVPGYLFSSSLPAGAGDFDGLPQCGESNVRYIVRSENEDSFPSLDIVVYQYDNNEQKQKAQSLGYRAVPFIEGALANPYRPDGDSAQTMIRALGLNCLPTRVRSVTRAGEKAFEYQEGVGAWKREEGR